MKANGAPTGAGEKPKDPHAPKRSRKLRPAPGARSDVARETLDRLGLLTEEDVAAMREVTMESIRNDRAAGAGPPFIKWGLKVFYRLEDLNAWLANQVQSGQRDRSRGAERSA